jgi:hypothetical protein
MQANGSLCPLFQSFIQKRDIPIHFTWAAANSNIQIDMLHHEEVKPKLQTWSGADPVRVPSCTVRVFSDPLKSDSELVTYVPALYTVI